jgi:hypothetical protein
VRRTVAVVAAAGLVALGCSGGEDEILDLQATPSAETEPTDQPDEPEPDVEDTEEPVDEPEPDDPYAVPDEIDEDYVERVINAILEVQDDVLRSALQLEQGQILTPEQTGLIFATSAGDQRQAVLDRLQGYVDDPETRGNLLPSEEMGRTYFHPEQLIRAEPEHCVLVIGFWENREVTTEPRADGDFAAFSLSRKPEDEEISEGNPTPWQWRDNAAMVDGEGPIPADRWEELDYDSALDHTCEGLK